MKRKQQHDRSGGKYRTKRDNGTHIGRRQHGREGGEGEPGRKINKDSL